MNLRRFNVDQIAGGERIYFSIYNNINFAFQNEKVFFHYIVVMSSEILSGHELYDGKIHTRALHQVFGTAVTEAVFSLVFIYNIHRILLLCSSTV